MKENYNTGEHQVMKCVDNMNFQFPHGFRCKLPTPEVAIKDWPPTRQYRWFTAEENHWNMNNVHILSWKARLQRGTGSAHFRNRHTISYYNRSHFLCNFQSTDSHFVYCFNIFRQYHESNPLSFHPGNYIVYI